MTTVFVERDENDAIKGVYRQKQEGYAEEELADDDPAVAEFYARIEAPSEPVSDRKAEIAEMIAKGKTVDALTALLELLPGATKALDAAFAAGQSKPA